MTSGGLVELARAVAAVKQVGGFRVGGGFEPRWKKDGSELYFLTSRNQGSDLSLMAVPMKADAQSGISAGTPVKLFDFESLVTILQNNSWLCHALRIDAGTLWWPFLTFVNDSSMMARINHRCGGRK